ncbi:MAG: outer membrane beta-barrel protein [Candidatus Omnitrophica bacterium]|nr:outer membrane beta-barrel protein [Candidatus Omnitrophota bacterium]
MEPAFAVSGKNLELHGSVSNRYTDNLLSAEVDEMEDFVTDLSLGFGFVKEEQTFDFSFIGYISQEIYGEYTQFNNTSEDLNFSFHKTFSKQTTLEITHDFRHAEQPEDFEDAFGRTTGLYSYYDNELSISLQHDLSKSNNITMEYSAEYYDLDRQDINSSLYHEAGLTWRHNRSLKTAFLAEYEFVNRDFIGGNDYSAHSALTGVERWLTSQVLLEIKGGSSFIETFTGDSKVRPKMEIRLTDDLSERTQFLFRVVHDYSSKTSKEDLFKRWEYSGRLKHKFSSRINSSCTLFYGTGEFDGLNLEDDFFGIRARGEYLLSDAMSVFLSYAYTDNNSNDPGREYTKNTVTAGLDIQF